MVWKISEILIAFFMKIMHWLNFYQGAVLSKLNELCAEVHRHEYLYCEATLHLTFIAFSVKIMHHSFI
jgi:hypothetical protein